MKFYWLRDEEWRPVTCIAYNDENPYEVEFQLATWNPLDNLSKDMGRMIAAGRLASRKGVFVVPHNGHVKRAIIEAIAADSGHPNRARKAASMWLSYENSMDEFIELIANSNAV